MSIILSLESITEELRIVINNKCTVKPAASQYNSEPEPMECFSVRPEGVYVPLGAWKDFLNVFPEYPEGTHLPMKPGTVCTKTMYTLETDPKGYRDQDNVTLEAYERLVRDHTVFIACPPGYGKCLAPDTLVLMFDGYKRMASSVKPGDLLMGDDSLPRIICSVTEGYDDMYEIDPVNGEKFSINSCHVLTLKTPESKVIDMELQTYLSLAPDMKSGLRLFWASIEYEDKDTPFDPYRFGYRELSNLPNGKCPLIYKINSREKRLSLLAGIIDREGYYINGRYEIIRDNEDAAHDILDICRSLGFGAFISHTSDRDDMSDKSDKKFWYLVSVSGQDLDAIPVRCETKRARNLIKIKDPTVADFKVRKLEKGRYCGFTLDGNGRFLLGSHMVTHNTSCGNYLSCEMGLKTLIMCHIDKVNKQWVEEFKNFSTAKVQLVKGKNGLDPTADVYVIGVLKAANMDPCEFAEAGIGMVIFDEAHVATVTAFSRSLLKICPKYVIGLSATPERSDGMQKLLTMYFGPKKNYIHRQEVKNFIVYKHETDFKPQIRYNVVYGTTILDWTTVLNSLAYDKERQILIANIALKHPEHRIMLLSDRIEECVGIYNCIVDSLTQARGYFYLEDDPDSQDLNSGAYLMDESNKKDKIAHIQKYQILIAGRKRAGIGFDDSTRTMLILCTDCKDVRQNEGRIRTTDNIVYDIVDNYSTLESHWNKRAAWYEKRGASIVTIPRTAATDTKKNSKKETPKRRLPINTD